MCSLCSRPPTGLPSGQCSITGGVSHFQQSWDSHSPVCSCMVFGLKCGGLDPESCPGVNSLLGVQYQASGEAWQIFPCHITKKAFLSFYRVTNVAKVFSDIFAVLELPNGKPNDQQAEAMQTVWSVRVSASSKLCCAGLAALCCSGRTSG